MCLITLTAVALGASFAGIGTALGATAAAAATVGAIAVGVAEVAIAGAVVGGVVSTVSAVQQAEAAQQQAELQASIEQENAKMAAIEAENIELQANQDRHQLRLRMLASRSSARATYAAGGVVLGRGTVADYEADIADAYDLDKRNLNYDVEQKRWQAKVQSVNASNQASLYTAQAGAFGQQKSTAMLSGVFNTTTDVVQAGVGALNFGTGLGKLSKEAGWA